MFVPSIYSDKIYISKKNNKFILNEERNDLSDTLILSAIKRINKSHSMNIKFIKFFLKKYSTGSSYHIGGSFKMNQHTNILSTDLLGRPKDNKKVSIIDSSILPSLPSNSHTFLTMVNAYRISNEVMKKIINL